jgi:hypothetical protein
MAIEFFIMPEEQAALLAAANRERPMHAVAEFLGDPSEPYVPVELAEERVRKVLEALSERIHAIRLYLRDASLEGGFVFGPHPNPAKQRNLHMRDSLCVEWWMACIQEESLLSGSFGILGRVWYEDAGLDPSVPRSLQQFLARKVRRLCPHRAAAAVTMDAVARGDISRPGGTAYVSEAAVSFRAGGGRWIGEQGRLEYVPVGDTP